MSGVQESPSGTASLLDSVLDVAHERGRPDVAAMLERARTLAGDPCVTVVVVGETKRGKSSFVNALVGETVSPVDDEAPSRVFASVVHAAAPAARVFTADAPDGFAVPFGAVSMWMGSDAQGERPKATSVEIGVPAPILEAGLRIIDTPGVGGLGAAHREVSLAALAWADALLFVLDPDAPMSRPEWAFLDDAAARIGSVALVLTKIDAYPDWELIADENRRLLETVAPRFARAPVLPVSSVEKSHGDDSGDPEVVRESGFPAVEAYLRERVAGSATSLRVWNLAETVRSAIAVLDRPERTTLESGTPSDIEARIEGTRRSLREHGDLTRNWTAAFFLEYQRRIANPVQLELRRRLQALSERYERRIEGNAPALESLPDDLRSELSALATHMRTAVVAASQELFTFLVESLSLGPVPQPRGIDMSDEALPLDFSRADQEPSPARPGLSRRLVGLSSLARSTLYGRSLSNDMGPVGLLVGVTMGSMALGGAELTQRGTRNRQAARSVLSKAMETARIEIDADIRARLLDAQQFVQQEIRLLVEQRRSALDEELARHQADRLADQAERERAKAEAGRRLEQTRPAREAADALCAELEDLIHAE